MTLCHSFNLKGFEFLSEPTARTKVQELSRLEEVQPEKVIRYVCQACWETTVCALTWKPCSLEPNAEGPDGVGLQAGESNLFHTVGRTASAGGRK